MITLLAALGVAYLLGSFPSAYVIGRLVKGIDIRKHGSGNVGASNVFRVIGRKWGILVLLLDILKGFLAATWVAPFAYEKSPVFSPLLYGLVIGMVTVAGHNWTIFLKFRGGKGVATSLGVGLGLLPKAALLAFALWVLLLIPFGYISVSSIVAALSFPACIVLLYRDVPGFPWVFAVSLVLAVLIVYMHRSNIQRLKEGKEHRVWDK